MTCSNFLLMEQFNNRRVYVSYLIFAPFSFCGFISFEISVQKIRHDYYFWCADWASADRRGFLIISLSQSRTWPALSVLLTIVWRCGVVVNTLVMINKVTLCRAWLVLGWVTICGRVNHLGM